MLYPVNERVIRRMPDAEWDLHAFLAYLVRKLLRRKSTMQKLAKAPARDEKGHAGRSFLSHSGSSNKEGDKHTECAENADAGVDDNSEFDHSIKV